MFSKSLKRLILALCMAGAPLHSLCAVITADKAHETASKFLNTGKGEQPELRLSHTAKNSAGTPAYYVFDLNGGTGFIIVSADDESIPVLGFSYDNPYSEDALAPSAALTLRRASETKVTTARRAVRAATPVAGKELGTAAWRQEAPFNDLIPGRRLIGCVGVAMGEIMRFHQWPQTGRGTLGDLDFNVTYDWNSMRADNYRGSYSDTEAKAVATLMAHAAGSIMTDFGMSSSSAFEVRVPTALINYFGYDPGVSYKKREETDKETWDRIIIGEIEAGRPVLYSGQDATAGHAFVCDGYKVIAGIPYFHINWGWGGTANGYYASDALNPQASRNYSFNDQTTIVYNIKPATTAGECSEIHLTADSNQPGLTADFTDLAAGSTFSLRAGALKNLSYSAFSGMAAVALTDADGKVKTLLSQARHIGLSSMQILNSGFLDFACTVPTDAEIATGDAVRLVTSVGSSGKWLPVAADLLTIGALPARGNVIPYCEVKIPSGIEGVSIKADGNRVVKGHDFRFSVTPTATGKTVTVKANGYILSPGNDYSYSIRNVLTDQTVGISVQNTADVVSRRTLWISPGQLESAISDTDAGTVTDLTLYGSMDVNDFTFIRTRMKLKRLDISSVTVAANGSNPANAIPAKAFSGYWSLKEIILPAGITALKSGCFDGTGLRRIEIPAGVSTYEYNIFLNCLDLEEVTVRRQSPAWVNWCVFAGTPKNTLVVPVGATGAYSSKENWNEFRNIVEKNPEPVSEYTVDIQDMEGVRITPANDAASVKPGDKYPFTVENDGRYGECTMEVYANSTRLYPDAYGTYTATINSNTLIHPNFRIPEIMSDIPSTWKITGNTGGTGLVTENVNVIPGKSFQLRVNALDIPADDAAQFFAVALTSGAYVKEIVSPITANNSNNHGKLPATFSCQVNDASVKEGNALRVVTSYDKKRWHPVMADNSGATDSLKAVGNEVRYHAVTIPAKVQGAEVTGAVTQAVHGMPLSFRVTPVSVADAVTVSVNGELKAADAKVADITIPCVTEDLDITIQVNPAGSETYTVVNVNEGELDAKIANCPKRLKVTGVMTANDFKAISKHATTITALDLADVTLKGSNAIPMNAFSPTQVAAKSVLASVILPSGVQEIKGNAFYRCMALKELTIPASVVKIGSGAFNYCPNLKKIVMKNQTPVSLTMNPFALGTTITLEVPKGSETAYAAATYWKDHNIVTSTVYYNIQIDPARTFGYNHSQTLTKIEEPAENEHKTVQLGLPNFVPTATKPEAEAVYRPGTAFRLYDNGIDVTSEMEPEGTYLVKFYGENKNPESLSCPADHKIDVVFHHQILFNLPGENVTCSLSSVNDSDIWKDADMSAFGKEGVICPALYRESRDYSFAVTAASTSLQPRVKINGEVAIPDENGIYTIAALNADATVDVTLVPTNGAVLSAEEIAGADLEAGADVTSIGLTGEIPDETFNSIRESFGSLRNLDLSEMSNAVIPDNAFAGMTELASVEIPEHVTAIGENAFSGCPNLETINLNSVESIGANAFAGCENLTSINLTSSTAAGRRAVNRAPAAGGISPDAFKGINPNCIIFTDNRDLKAAEGLNVVFNGEGTRVALSDITLTPENPFNTPGSFHLDGHRISLTAEIGEAQTSEVGNWSGLVIPFTPSEITMGGISLADSRKDLRIMSVSEEKGAFSESAMILANVPCVVRLEGNGNGGKVTFSLTGKAAPAPGSTAVFDIRTTPENGITSAAGKEFTVYGCYGRSETAADDYILDDAAEAFVRAGDATGSLRKPFSVYLNDSTGLMPERIEISKPTSGTADTINADGSGLRFISGNGSLTVISPDERHLDIYAADGSHAACVRLQAGHNTINLLPGIYVAGNIKVAVR